MHSCPKKTSEAMFDWMATTALKTLIRKNYNTYNEHPSGCSFCITEFEANKNPPHLPQSNANVENRVGLGC